MSYHQLLQVRKEIADIDLCLLELIKKRLDLACKAGALKKQLGMPLRDFGTEAKVIERNSRFAQKRGISDELNLELCKVLMKHALICQQADGPLRELQGGRSMAVKTSD